MKRPAEDRPACRYEGDCQSVAVITAAIRPRWARSMAAWASRLLAEARREPVAAGHAAASRAQLVELPGPALVAEQERAQLPLGQASGGLGQVRARRGELHAEALELGAARARQRGQVRQIVEHVPAGGPGELGVCDHAVTTR